MRTFVAIQLSPEVRKQLFQNQKRLKELKADVKWVEEENFHITLSFLGEIKVSQADQIIGEIRKNLPSISPFVLNLSGLGVFPNKERPRVIWVGVTKGKEEIILLYNFLKELLEPCGFDFSKKYTPHVTLGRVRSSKNMKALISLLPEIQFKCKDFIEGISLMESRLSPKGPIYTELAYFKFGPVIDRMENFLL